MEKTDAPSFDEASAPKPTVHPEGYQKRFHETTQPIGVHFHAFLDDFVFDYIPANSYELLDKNSARLRGILLEAENTRIEVGISKVSLTLWLRIEKEGVEWKVSI
jgi:hypothetical protein